MDKREIKSLLTLVMEREDVAYKRLKDNPCYLEICERQNKTEEIVENLYHERFTDEERLIIRRHYEGETDKENYEINEIYIQGVRDCFKLIMFLGFFT